MTLINELAKLLGFHESYIDSFGNKVIANEDALTRLIMAMGYDLSNEALVSQHILELKEKTWRNLIAKVHIEHVENTEHTVSIYVACKLNDGSTVEFDNTFIDYKIEQENGELISKSIAINELTCTDSRDFTEGEVKKYQLVLPKLPLGYHKLTVTFANMSQDCALIYAPRKCYNIEQASPNKIWGIATQLYSIKSENNWGMGDYTDLLNLSKNAASRGASVIGVNPLHALFSNNPTHFSPYSPSSRNFLNTLYIDPTSSPLYELSVTAKDLVNSAEFQQELQNNKNNKLVDYQLTYSLKDKVLRLLFDELCQTSSPQHAELNEEFSAFKQETGESLLQLATYEALYAHFKMSDDNLYGWLNWPSQFQQYQSNAVKEFQLLHQHTIDYYSFLQWLAHQQLSNVSQTCKKLGMPLGLYLDLAVGCDGSGVEIWANQSTYLSGASVGAPPDQMNLLGQDWGLTPINPIELSEQGYQPLINALRSNMQYAGALRIDHILGLKRQYWVAPGMKANEGIYINFPFDDILSIIALESQRNQCVVIGEDLGTVPEGFTEYMQQSGLLSYKVLYFERWWESGLFKRPDAYDQQSMATVSTHDLPTLAGWWSDNDLSWREKLDLYPTEGMGKTERSNRILDRERLIAAFIDLGVIASEDIPSFSPPVCNQALLIAAQKYLALSPSHLHLVQVEDCIELVEQANIPGTVHEHPNWQQKLPVTEADIWDHPTTIKLTNMLQLTRPK